MTPSRRRMACRELVELVTDYLEGALRPSDRARFERHLAGCPGCQAYVDQMRETLRLLGHIGAESFDSAACDQLLHAFRDWVGE